MRGYDKGDLWRLLDSDEEEPIPLHRQPREPQKPRHLHVESLTEVPQPDVELSDLKITYRPSRHESGWIIESLGDFYQNEWISDILRLVKGGKEASVYQCKADPRVTQGYMAAKVYRPRRFRSLKNDYIYREGRDQLDEDGNVIIDDGKLHAIRKKTAYGLVLMHTSWIEHEYQTLQVLHAAGADTPVPYASGNNAILMEYIGDENQAAPTLNSVDLESIEAGILFERVIHNVELMLANGCVHGDLSAFNILYWEGDIKLIDFPQVTNPITNRSAYRIFERDLIRVCEYFERMGVHTQAVPLAAKLWTAYKFRLAPEVDPGLLDEESEADREYWKQYGKGNGTG
jgi:RIO kinase 1